MRLAAIFLLFNLPYLKTKFAASRLKELEDDGLNESSSSEDEDEDGELITPTLDKQILQTLQRQSISTF